MKSRKYKSGSRWAFWRYTEVDSEYITRLFLVKTPWFAICLHWINKPDPEPYLHDHPVSFLSIILRGGYSEKRDNGGHQSGERSVVLRKHRWWNFIRATDRHTIVEVEPKTVTLAFMGPKVRTWGYHVPSLDGVFSSPQWIPWKQYNDGEREYLKMVTNIRRQQILDKESPGTTARAFAECNTPEDRMDWWYQWSRLLADGFEKGARVVPSRNKARSLADRRLQWGDAQFELWAANKRWNEDM